MKSLVTATHVKGRNLYIESETGTGKTLAALCAILSFIKTWEF